MSIPTSGRYWNQSASVEGHVAEVMWRSKVKGNLYGPFFDLLNHLNGPPTYTYISPLFDSWDIASLIDGE